MNVRQYDSLRCLIGRVLIIPTKVKKRTEQILLASLVTQRAKELIFYMLCAFVMLNQLY